MIDGGLWGLIRDNLRGPHHQRIESALTALGIPDVNSCHDGVEIWIELKATSAWAVSFRPFQTGWLSRRARAGGRTFLMVRRRREPSPRLPACDELWVFRGADARLVEEGGLRACEPLLLLTGGPSQWDWEAVRECLFRKSAGGTPEGARP